MRYKGGEHHEALWRLFENQRAINCKQEPPHRILGFATAGGFSAIRVAYELTVLYEFGLTHAITDFCTVSGGGGPVGGYLSGDPSKVAPVFEYLAKNKLMNGSVLLPRFNMPLYQRALRGEEGPGGFRQKEINAHPARWTALATSVHDASPVELCAKKDGRDSAEVVAASSAMPGTCPPVEINGRKLCDGACHGALQVQRFLGKNPSIDTVIVFQSRPHPKHYTFSERRIWPIGARAVLFVHRIRSNIRGRVACMDQVFIEEVEALSRSRVVWGRIAPTSDDARVGVATSDIYLLRRAGEEAARFLRQCLRDVRPPRWV